MRCGDAIDLLSQYREGDLGAARRGEVEAHLRACRRCRQEFAAVGAALAWLHDLQAEPAPPGLVGAVRARLQPPVERPRAVLLRWALPVGAAALLVVVAFGILHVTSRRTPSARVPAPTWTAATPRALLGRPEVTAPAAVPPASTAGAESQAATPVLAPPPVGAGLPTGPRAGTEPRPYRRPQAAVPSAAAPPAPLTAERDRLAVRPQAPPPVPPPGPAGPAGPRARLGPAVVEHGDVALKAAEALPRAPEEAERSGLAVPARAATKEQAGGAPEEGARMRAGQPGATAPTVAAKASTEVFMGRAGGAASLTVRAQATSAQAAARNLTLQLRTNEQVDNAQVTLRGANARAPEVVVWQGRLEKSAANSVDVQLPPAGAHRQELVIRGPQLNSQAYYVFAPSGAGKGLQGPAASKPKLDKRRGAAATWDDVLQQMASDRGVYVLAPAGFPKSRRAGLGARPVESALRNMGYEVRADSGALVIEARAARAGRSR